MKKKRIKLKNDARDEIIKSRYGYNVNDVNNDPSDLMGVFIDFFTDNDKRRTKYGS